MKIELIEDRTYKKYPFLLIINNTRVVDCFATEEEAIVEYNKLEEEAKNDPERFKPKTIKSIEI